MIFLVAAALVILPLAILDCMKRKLMDPEPTLLPFSTMDKTAPAATSKEVLMPMSTPPSKSPLPPQQQQPHSDGNKNSSKSKTSKDATDKPSSRPRSGAKPLPLTPRPEMFNAFGPPRRSLKRSPQMDPQLKTGREAGTRTPTGRPTQPPSGPHPGSKKSTTKKSRKASIPKSRSWKEYPAKPKVTITQSKTNLTSYVNNSDGIKSALTALSEYVFEESKFKVLGKVDQVIAASDEVDVLNRALGSDQSVTCHSPTDAARSPYFDGQFDVWVADRVGSQAEG